MRIHPLSGTDELNDFRFACKSMANIISVKKLPAPPPWGRFPFKQINEKVREGNPTIGELSLWYPRAINLVKSI